MKSKPALIVFATTRGTLPTEDGIRKTVVSAIEDGWGTGGAIDFITDVRKDKYMFQDEKPPAEPIEMMGVAVIFSQLPVTMFDPLNSPFRVVTTALDDAYDDIEMVLDAVEQEEPRENSHKHTT